MTLLLYTGCLIPSRLPFLERATRDVLAHLGVEHADLPGATCCMDPIGLRSLGMEAWLLASSRLLAIAEENGGDILTVCDGCHMSLDQARLALENPGTREAVNRELARIGRSYSGNVRVVSLLEVLHSHREGISASVEVPQGRRFALHPGCHLERVAEKVGGESPSRLMADLVRWVGGEPLEQEGLCCGGGVAGIEEDIARGIRGEALSAFSASGAEVVLTPCPTCFAQFDLGQREGMPIWFISELLMSAFGLEYKGWRYHRNR